MPQRLKSDMWNSSLKAPVFVPCSRILTSVPAFNHQETGQWESQEDALLYPIAGLWWVTLTLEGCPYWMTCFTFVIVPCRAATSMAAYTTFALHFLVLTHPFRSLCSPYVNLAKCQFFYLFSPLWGIRKSTLRHFNFESDLIFPTCLHNRK